MCLIILMIECPVLIDWLSMNTVCQFDSSQIISPTLVFTNVNKFLSCSVWLSAWLIVNLSDPILLVQAMLPTGTDGQDGSSDALVNIKYYQYMYPIKFKLVTWNRSSKNLSWNMFSPVSNAIIKINIRPRWVVIIHITPINIINDSSHATLFDHNYHHNDLT